jgi:hypothetical protein
LITINVPIGEFIPQAVRAASISDHLAFLVIIARTIDGKALQDELYEQWDSLNDITSDHILLGGWLTNLTYLDTYPVSARYGCLP